MFLLSVWRQWMRDVPSVIRFVLGAGFVVALWFHRHLSRQSASIIMAVGISLLSLLLVHKVVGAARIWLFLLPLFLTTASAGVGYILWKVSKSESQKAVLASMISVLIAIGLGSKVLSTRSVLASEETGTLRDAEAITMFLKPRLKDGVRVLAMTPSDAPLWYYFDLYGLPWRYLDPRNRDAARSIVVVNTTHHQSLSNVLDRFEYGASEITNAKVIARFDSAVLYEIEKSN